MARKKLTRLKAKVCRKGVELSCYKGTPFFQSENGKRAEDVICVYRKSEPDFVFGQDYEEYFDGLDPSKAVLIFNGMLRPVNKRKFEFIDHEVEIGKTYAYWVAMDGSDTPVGPAPVRVRDFRVWWPQAETERRMRTLADAYPGKVTLKRFGKTVKGRPLNGLVAGNRANTVALIGTIHAGESGPELIVPALERLIEENSGLLDKVGVATIPSVNIDERERLVNGFPPYLRVNANGVDINRNFDANWEEVAYGYGFISSDPEAMTCRGECPASEPETEAIMRFVGEIKPVVLLSFHALASICGACFLFPKAAAEDERFVGNCKKFGDVYGTSMYPDGEVKSKIRAGGTQGSLPTWLYLRHRIVGFDLEYDGAEHARPSLTDMTTVELIEEYQERHYCGLVALMNGLTR